MLCSLWRLIFLNVYYKSNNCSSQNLKNGKHYKEETKNNLLSNSQR